MREKIRKSGKKPDLSNQATEILESISDGFFALDREWSFIYVNRRAASNLGLKPEDLVGQNLWEKFPGILGSDHEKYYRKATIEGQAQEFETHGVLTDQWYNIRVYPSANGISVYWQDISQRKQAEEALLAYKNELERKAQERAEQVFNERKRTEADLDQRIAERTADLSQREERFRILMDNLHSGVALIDESGKFVTYNSSFLKMFGMKDDSTILNVNSQDWSAWQVYDADGTTLLQVDEHPVRKAALTGKPVKDRLVGVKLPSGDTLTWMLINAEPVLKPDGKIRYLIATYYDITDRRKAEETLRHYTTELEAANKELEAFSYSVSHDLRAPLRTLDGFSEAVLEDYGDKLDETGQNYLNRIRKASQTMAQLIDDMLKLSRISRAEMRQERVNLSNLIESILEEIKCTQPDRSAEFIIAPDITVKGDKNLLQIGLRNLLENAWKYTGKCPFSRIAFGVLDQKENPVYFIRDNGVGFDMQYKDKLFQPFQRLHTSQEYPGTGIGLATVQRVVRRHGGRIWAESEVGKGTTFYFTLEP